jgi:superfamily II DNA or RNA helicase
MELRDYQVAAAESWRDSSFRSILSMATGTGKTVTTIAALKLLITQRQSDFLTTSVVVICPLLNLVDQWESVFHDHGWATIKAYGDASSWEPVVAKAASKSAMSPGSRLIIIVTQATFLGPRFQAALSTLPGELALVGDEVHNLGTKFSFEKLPSRAMFRLGLSATPERWGDEIGTKRLIDYFGPESFNLHIGEAIEKGILCPYTYQLRIANMDFEETESYVEVVKDLAQLLGGRDITELSEEESKIAGSLLTARASILGHVASKLAAFENDLLENRELPGQLIYCAEGRKNGGGARQVESVVNFIHGQQLGRAEIYDANTPRETRKKYIDLFTRGEIQFLVSMRCLDEGIDVPNASIAYFLSSSANPRQFIQRRGRVLRKNQGKNKAIIFDYFSAPSAAVDEYAESVASSLFRREIARALDFIASADNPRQAFDVIEPFRRKYE